MPNPITVLLLLVFLHGGTIETHGVVVPSKLFCEEVKDTIIHQYIEYDTIVLGKKVHIDKVTGSCVVINS